MRETMKDIMQVVGMAVAIVYILFVLGSFAWMRHVTRTYLRIGRAPLAPDEHTHTHTEFCLDHNGRDCPDRVWSDEVPR